MAASRMRWRRMARRTMTTNKSWGIGVARGARRIVVEMTAAMRVRMMRSERRGCRSECRGFWAREFATDRAWKL